MSLQRRTVDYAQAVLIVGLAWALRYQLNPFLGPTGTAYSLFFLAIILSAWLGGRGPGVLAMALGFLICTYFYVLPGTRSPSVLLVQLTIYVFVGASILRVVDAMQTAERRVQTLKTELEQQNRQLERERDRFRVTLASIEDAVITVSQDQRIDYMNPVAERLTGYALVDAHGESVEKIVRMVHANSGERIDWQSAPSTAQALDLNQLLVSRQDVSVPVLTSSAPVQSQDGKTSGTVYVFRDATALRNYELTLKDNDERKDEFLAVLAHELRNPLAPIQNAAALLQHSGAPLGKQGTWAVDVIQRQLRQMVRLVNDLLDIARITRGKLELQREAVKIDEILAQAVESSRHLIDAGGHELQLHFDAGDVQVYADKARAAQLFSNLLNNAAQYTPPGGRIALSTRLRGDTVEIEVSDTGIGIAPEALRKVFQMFTRADRQGRHHSGLGVGLGLSKTLAELHNGDIQAYSEGAGRGSRFVVSLAVSKPEPAPLAVTATPTDETPILRRRVLVVDDNIDAANSLAELLRFSGHMVQVAYDPFVALQVYTQFKPETLILDIGLPGMDGYELARRLRALKLPQLMQIVALTGWGRPEDVEKAMEAGFDRHMTKPVMPEQLEDIMQQPVKPA